MVKKLVCVLAVILVVLLAAAIWEPVMDALPIDQSHWVGKDDRMYHVGKKGDLDTGWYEEGGHRYYLDPDNGGAMVTGWTEIDGKPYCFSEAGLLVTGWVETEAGRQYLGQDGLAVTGWLEREEGMYYLDERGYALTGWQEIGGNRYCMDNQGLVRTGWYQEAGENYYLGEAGVMATGWISVGEDRYYLDKTTGAAVRGWLDMPEGRYYLDEWGGVCTGWQDIDGSRYYLNEQGIVHTGWLELEEDRYYLAEDGAMITGWLELEEQRYYFLESGAAARGRHEIDGQVFYFTSTGANIILVNRWNYLPEDYQPNIVRVLNVRVDESCADALVEMAEACEAAGYDLWIRSSYRTNGDQQYLLNNKIQRLQATGMGYDDAYAKAIQSVAIPGTSEHQLGLAVDIVDADYTALNEQQSQTDTQKWLMEHCWEYGFILRYPDGTTEATGIIYEPWHYRYVGRELALELRDLGICLEDYLDMLNQDAESCGGRTE